MAGSLAQNILDGLGGPSNIKQLENCMTRLRVSVANPEKVDKAKLEGLPKVLSVIDARPEFQVVLGPGVADNVCKEIKELGIDVKQGEAVYDSVTPKMTGKSILEFLSRVFAPLIPIFAGAGLLFGIKQVFVLIFDLTGAAFFNPAAVADGGSVFMAALALLAGTFFTFLNIAIAMSACKQLGGNPYLGLVAGGIVSNVGNLAGASMGILGLTFTNGRGGALAALAAGALCAVVEKAVKKHTPGSLAVHMPSLVTIVVVGLLTLFVLQPLLGFVMDLITNIILWCFNTAGPLATALVGFMWLPMVMLGVHQGLTPIQTQLIQELGYTPLYPAGSMAGGGQVGASIALLVKYRNRKGLKKAIHGGLPAGILGIGEPLIYGVSMPLGRVFWCACAGAAVGATILGFFPNSGSVTINVSGILGTLVNTQPLVYLMAYAVSILAGFLIVYFVGAKPEDLDAFEASHSEQE